MQVTRKTAITGLVLTSALALSGCGSDDNTSKTASGGAPSSSTDASTDASATPSSGSSDTCGKGSLTAAGSTAQANAMAQWTKSYQGTCSDATINYQGGGSGAGVQQFIAGTVDFAGSDSALKPEEHPKADARCKTGPALDLPMVVGPIAIAYNLPDVKDLVLDAPTIAKIFSGKVTTWNDPAIKALNGSAKLPSTKIQAFHRSDESGTTDNVQKYLTAAAPTVWTYGAGKKFAAPGGQSAKGSDGLAQAVKSTPGAVTYVEKSFADNGSLSVASLSTGAGDPVKLSTDSASKAVEAAKVTGTGQDLSLKLDYATKAPGAYPLVLVTYEIVCSKGTDADKLALLKGFLTYTSSAEGQGVLAENGYAPLPAAIQAKVADAVKALA